MVVSSRKEDNVRAAVEKLSIAVPENLDVSGVVCHVGKEDYDSVCENNTTSFKSRLLIWSFESRAVSRPILGYS